MRGGEEEVWPKVERGRHLANIRKKSVIRVEKEEVWEWFAGNKQRRERDSERYTT